MLNARFFLRGAYWLVFLSTAAVACGGDNDDAGGDDSNDAGSGAESGEAGSSGASGSSAGGSDSGGGGSGGDGGGSSGKGGSSSGGSSGKGGTAGSGAGATGPALDRIEEACRVDCDAQFALECAPVNQNPLTCRANCAAQTSQLGDFCLVEYAEVVECRGSGGYDCVMDRPYQRSTCAPEQLAFTMCLEDIGCKRACDKSVDEGCTSMSLDECIEACIAEGEALPERCVYTWDSIAACQVTGDAACVDGELETPMACAASVIRVAECIWDESTTMDMCEAWCWGADTLGCGGSDCATECANRLADSTCGTAWSEAMDCGLFFGDAGCVDGFLAANGICDSDAAAYTTCVAGAM